MPDSRSANEAAKAAATPAATEFQVPVRLNDPSGAKSYARAMSKIGGIVIVRTKGPTLRIRNASAIPASPQPYAAQRRRPLPIHISQPDRAARRAADPAKRMMLLQVVASVVEALRVQPGIGSRQLRASVRALRGHSSDADTDAALKLLGNAISVLVGPRGDRHYTLDLARAPSHMRAYLACLVAHGKP